MITIKYKNFIFFEKKVVGNVHRLLLRYGVKYNSYAGGVLKRIYHFYFGDATNIKKEFKKYYRKEFRNLNDYLECHLGLPEKIRNIIIQNKVFYVNLNEKGEHTGDAFYYEDELKSQFWSFVGGINDENPRGFYYEQFLN